eukprot:TRINITY_DN26_c0_g1_i8.p1 TRINITY_DN26_c0_g1~~TRINITY_DN26_c0_g1_i8.p1  ORF type:complete len:401 (+),score=68.40 TRINITY_DN26_c0_g1_i8:57-1205(+)
MSVATMFVAASAFAQLPIHQDGGFWQSQVHCVGQSGNQQCTCPSGMSIVGVERTMDNVDGIDYFKCAKAQFSIGTKNCQNVALPNTYPWHRCPAGKVMTGVHTSCGQQLDCIDALECCDYEFPGGATYTTTEVGNVDWWGCLDANRKCDSGAQFFLSGFFRHPNGCGHLHCIEQAFAHTMSMDCPAHASGSTCQCDSGYSSATPVSFGAGGWTGSCTCDSVSLSTTGLVAPETITGATHTGASGLELAGIPAYLQGAEAFFPSLSVADGTTATLSCCGTECTFFVAVYHCSPCSQNRNGKLIGELLSNGWEGSSCAPTFVLDSRGYPMTILHKTTTGDLTLTTEGPTDFLAIFKIDGGVTTPLCRKNQGPSAPGGCNTQCAP